MGFQHQKPAWLDALYVQKFFALCSIHETAKKNEKNILCIDCCTSICPHCVMAHRTHRLLQVRRYVYHNVVRLEDLEKLIDCSNVQAYTINASKVVFIKKRPQNRHFKGSGNYCTSCDRCLQEPFIHCSLGCKVEFVLKHYGDLGQFLRKCTTLLLGPDFFIPNDFNYFGGSADEEMTSETPRSTVVDSGEPPSSSSGSSGSENNNNSNGMSFICTDFVRKKRTGLYVCNGRSVNKINTDEDMATSCMNMMGNRRKRAPQRSPFC